MVRTRPSSRVFVPRHRASVRWLAPFVLIAVLSSTLPLAASAAGPSPDPSPSTPGVANPPIAPPPDQGGSAGVLAAGDTPSAYFAEDAAIVTRNPTFPWIFGYTGYPSAHAGKTDVYGDVCCATVTWNLTGAGTLKLLQFGGRAQLFVDGQATLNLTGRCADGNTQSISIQTGGTHSFQVTNMSDDFACNARSWAFDGFSWELFDPTQAASQTAGSGDNRHQNNPTAMEGEPVNTYSGNYTSQVTDLALPGRGLGFAFTRTYNSIRATSGGPLGPGWTHNFAARLVTNPDGSITFLSEDGAAIPFYPDGAGGYQGGSTVLSTLAPDGAGGFVVTRPDQVRHAFDSSGWLTALRDRNNNALTFAYTGADLTTITDTVGRTVTLTYDGSGRIIGLAAPVGRSVTFAYDPSGRLASATDVRGGVTTYGYDAANRLATITDQNGHVVVTNTYGADGRVIEQVDPRGFHSTYGWNAATETSTFTDARGGAWVDDYAQAVLTSRSDPLGNTTTYAYDGSAKLTAITDPRGNSTTMTYDGRGNLLTRTAPAPLSFVETYTYDATNNVLSYRDRRANTTTYTYDAAGNLRTVTGPPPVSPLTIYTYDPAGTGLLVSVTDPRGKLTAYAYDPQANRNRITSPLGNVTTMTYDAAGRMISLVEPRGNVTGANPADYTTTFTYDNADRVLTGTDPLSNVTTFTYDPAGNRLTMTDANNHTTTYGYDAANHLTTVSDARNGVTTYAYDQVGNLTSRTDANTRTTTFAYDLAGRLTTETRPLSRVWTYDYDANGNRTKVVDALGNSTPMVGDGTTTFTYDALNRVTRVVYSDASGQVDYTLDANGNRTQMVDPAGISTYTYDALNRLTSYRRGSFGIDYGYDPIGNVTSRTYTDGTLIALAYDDDGRPASLTSGGVSTTYVYDPAGHPTTTTFPAGNGSVETRTYDRAGRLTEVKHQKGTAVLSRFTYTLDPVGNRIAVAMTSGTTTYTYDELDRLTLACYTVACSGPGDDFRRYTYDPTGNRLTEVRDTGTTTSAYNAADELLSTSGPGGTVSYTHDLDGRLTAAGSRSFSWALPARLTTTASGNTTSSYTYDGDGLRLKASSGTQAAKNIFFEWDLVAPVPLLVRERDGNDGFLRRYRYGLGLLSMDSGPKTYYVHPDGLGSTANVTSSTGAPQWTYTYHPFGELRTETKNDTKAPTNLLKFAGEYQDPTGLYHLRARQYDPTIGRFTATDPAAAPVTDPYLSSYVYVANNPVLYVDPSGRESQAPSGGFNLPPAGGTPATDVRVPGSVPLIGGCKAVQLGVGLGLVFVGAAFEVAAGLGEVLSAGTATPLVALGIAVGAGDIFTGIVTVGMACQPNTNFP